MNLSNLKQRLQNNLWHGEQRRAFHYDHEMFSLVATYIEPDYTKAWYIDISPWDGGAVQLGVTKSLGCSGVWIKGVDGSVNSNHFVANYTTAVSVGLPRSAYAWLYRDANVRATAQAQAFDTLLNKYPPSPELLPLVDFEYTKYAGAQSNPDFTDLRKWLTEWLRLGNPKPIVYSGKYYMDQFGAMPSDVRGMIAGLHIANYSSLNPPLPIGFTEWVYHQFSSSGDAMKIAPNNVNKLALDLNYGHGAIVPPSNIADGYQQLRRNDADVYLWRGAPKRVHVTNTGGKLETVSSAAQRLDADFAINGDGWVGGVDVPLSYAASDGNFYQRVSFDARPYFSATQANGYSINHVTPTAPYNLVSGTRYLVKNGANVYAGSTDPNYTSVLHPRTAIGITNDGKIILCVVDGRTTQSAGMTLQNLAALMMEAGAVWALEMDGGGSSAMVKSGVVQNVPSDGTERAVSNHLLIYTEGQTMYTGNAKITATPNVRLRQANADGTANPTGTTIGAIQPGQAFKADLLSPDKAWLRITEIGGKTVQALYNKPYGYSATLYLDYKEVVVVPPPVEPPPPAPTKPVSVTVTLEGYKPLTLSGEMEPV